MTEPLSLVREDDIDAPLEMPESPPAEIPAFEGQVVTATKAKITSVNGLEIGDRIFRVDDSIKMIVEAKVVGVQHQVHEPSGTLHRIHVLKAVETVVIDWEVDLDKLSEVL